MIKSPFDHPLLAAYCAAWHHLTYAIYRVAYAFANGRAMMSGNPVITFNYKFYDP